MRFKFIADRVLAFQSRWSCAFILFLYALFCSESLPYAEQMGMSVWEYVLYMISDHYYLIYVWFFYLLYWSTKQITQERAIERVRYGSHRKYQEVHCGVQAIQLLVVVLLHAAIAFFMGTGRLKSENAFLALGQLQAYDSNMDVVVGYSEIFNNPAVAVMFVALYWWIGSQFLCRILFYANEIWKNKGMFLLMFVALLSGIIGFVTHADESVLAIFFYNNYFVLHHALLNAGLPVTIGILLIMVMLPFGIVSIKNRRKFKEKEAAKYIRNYIYMNPIIIIIFLAMHMFLGIIPCWKEGVTVFEIMFSLTKGFSFRMFSLTEFLYTVVYFMFPIFLVNAFWEKEKENQNKIAMFRLGSREKWTRVIEKVSVYGVIRYFVYYVVISILALAAGTLLFRMDSDGFLSEIIEWYEIGCRKVWLALFVSMVMRGIELLILYQMSLLLYRVTKQTMVSFLFTFMLYVLGFFDKFNVLGLGRSSLYQMLEIIQEIGINAIWLQVVTQMGILSGLIIINYIWRKITWKQLLN